MHIRSKIKITGQKPNLIKILSKLSIPFFEISESNDGIILNVEVSSLKYLQELKRRLGAKKDRPNTRICILGWRKIPAISSYDDEDQEIAKLMANET